MLFFMEDIEGKIEVFKNISSKEELAKVLGISFKNLVYNLHIRPIKEKYTTFTIRKKSGGKRKICAPISGIKLIQRNLSLILNDLYIQKFCVHGYVKKRSIISNAKVHSRKRIIVNLDLKDYFPSINFGRVRGLFKAPPFLFNDEVATTLAQICCYENSLPQGAPSSPIISNYICRKLDSQLFHLCRDCKTNYSRYADDLTFSTNLKELPPQIGVIKENKIVISRELKAIMKDNGFIINRKKTRFALKNNRQDVTGLIVNEGINVPRKYIRHVRAMLHAWERYGLEKAAKEHFEKYNCKHKKTDYPELSFKNELAGKINYIGQIKGRRHRVYVGLLYRIKALDSTVKLSIPEDIDALLGVPVVFCEGKTDRLHLMAALNYFRKNGEFLGLNIRFFQYRDGFDINNTELLKALQTRPTIKRSDQKEIFLFDRDVPRCNKEVSDNAAAYKSWGNNVYSALLPIPQHRNFEEIFIEHYYTDNDLVLMDRNNRRMYLSNEFDSDSGMHRSENLIYRKRTYLKANYTRILSDGVYRANGDNVALSKYQFAQCVYGGDGHFKNISFENFRPIFQLLEEIVKLS